MGRRYGIVIMMIIVFVLVLVHLSLVCFLLQSDLHGYVSCSGSIKFIVSEKVALGQAASVMRVVIQSLSPFLRPATDIHCPDKS